MTESQSVIVHVGAVSRSLMCTSYDELKLCPKIVGVVPEIHEV
jgi:hypothetical protein